MHTISLIETCNFNGFRTFDAFMHNLNAKAYIRLLTANQYTGTNEWKIRIQTEIIPWHRNHATQIYTDKIPNTKNTQNRSTVDILQIL